MKSLFIFFALITTFGLDGSQDHQPAPSDGDLLYQYGSSKELNGVKKIFIDTGMNLELRDQIVKGIQSQLGNLVAITETAKEAQVVLVFSGGVRSTGQGIWKERRGKGAVAAFVNPNTVRLLITYTRPKEYYRVGHHPADDFAQVFVNGYREANNLDRNNKPKR